MKSFFVIISIVMIMGLSYADDPIGNGTISDGDKTSSRIGDMITSVEQAQKAVGAVQGTKKAVDLAKNLNDINLKEKALKELKGAVLQYKNSKQSFIQFVGGITEKITEVLDKANNRVNMWRTTEPTLIAFGDGLKLMADNTAKVFQEFEPKDLIDIDRKWDRKLEQQLTEDKRFVLGCIFFLNYSSSINARNAFNSLFLNDDLKKHMTSTPLGIRATARQMTVPIHTYHTIPSIVLNHAGASIEAVGKITAYAHEKSELDPSISKEQQDYQKIAETLAHTDQTYEDAQELASFIALKRQTVATQSTQLSQMYATLQADLARMYLNDQEIIALQAEQVTHSLKMISRGTPITTIKDQMQPISHP